MKTNQSKRKSSSSNMIREISQKKREATSTSSPVRRDRISELPDEILHHILSFLTTKSAMKTSVLSKRWRRVWACCPVLRLDQREFSSASKFASFVDGVRALHVGLNLQRLVMSWQQGFDVLKVEALVKHAMMHGLKEIWVESPAGRGGRALPGFLFHGGARVFIYSLST